MSIKLYEFATVMFFIALSAGCGGSNCSVTGTVTFPDGSPLTEGEVLFESPVLMSKGVIQKNGTYAMSTGELKGVPKGTYQVTISVPMEQVISSGIEGKPPTIIPLDIPIARKFFSPATSGLTCEVKGRTKYDIKVEAPEK